MSEAMGGGSGYKESSLLEPQSIVPEDLGHPVRILIEDHELLIAQVEHARDIARSLKGAKGLDDKQAGAMVEQMRRIADYLLESENHYEREENCLFPYVEKHGITGPTAAMWVEHETIRENKKNYHALVEQFDPFNLAAFADEMAELSDYLRTLLATHFYKENNILFQMALKVVTDDEWVEMRKEFDELGYCCFKPEPFKLMVEAAEAAPAQPQVRGAINFETGYFLPNELEALLNTIPLEITFIDSNDEVRYFNRSQERLFIRTKASLGRKVQQCHPQKSLHLVNEIVNEFKSGKRDVADFWIEFEGRFVHIRFFPVRDPEGNYLGAMEVVQDITDIKKLHGEKRLL